MAVKAPRDPDITFDPDDPEQSEGDVDPPEGEGLDQGAAARVQETLTAPAAALTPADATPAAPPVRTYVGVAFTTSGRPGPTSRRAAVPLVPPPPTPPRPEVTYTESAVVVQWPPAAQEAGNVTGSKVGYHVYDVTGPSETPLTKMPLVEPHVLRFADNLGRDALLPVRAVETVDALTVESEGSEPACVVLTDRFPPAAPKDLQAVASEGVINLIWDANTEPDLDGYYLLRGPVPGDELVPVTTALIRETAFRDQVPSGMRFVYALQAVDRAGNLGPISERTEETAR